MTTALPDDVRGPRRPGRRRHPVRTLLIVLIALAVLLVVAFAIGERVFRSYAEGQIEKSINASLPTAVQGSLTAQIQGFSALQQWTTGKFDDVVLTSNDLKVNGATATARFDVHGLPVDGAGAVPDATGTLTVGQAAFRGLPALVKLHAAAPGLKPGHVTTSLKETYLGISVDVDVTLVPQVSGKYIRLSPTSATIKSGVISLPATDLVKQAIPNGVSVCTASSLPPGVELTTIAVGAGTATVTLVARDLTLADLQSGRTGSC